MLDNTNEAKKFNYWWNMPRYNDSCTNMINGFKVDKKKIKSYLNLKGGDKNAFDNAFNWLDKACKKYPKLKK